VVEGYMDVIALAQAGFADAVAPLGTALTEQQIEMLWRMTEKPVICFDGDAAGQKAAMRAALRAMPLLKPGHSLQFITLPEGQDPDDLVKKSGSKALSELIISAEQLVDRLWQFEVAAGSLATPEDRASLKQRLGVHVNNIGDNEIRRHYSDAFNQRFDGLFAQKPRTSFSQRGKGPWQKPNVRPLTNEARGIGSLGTDLLTQGILVNLLRNPRLISAHREALSELLPRNPNHTKLLSAMIDATISKETLDPAALLTILEPHLYNVASALIQGDAKAFAFNRGNHPEVENDWAALTKNMGEMIKLMKQRPLLEAALEGATLRVSAELTEENYAEQQRLRSEKEAFDRRIYALTQRDADI
jgi:DNA primase